MIIDREKLREMQYANGFTVEDIGKMLNCHRCYVSGILTGRFKPSPSLSYRINKLLDPKSSIVETYKAKRDKAYEDALQA